MIGALFSRSKEQIVMPQTMDGCLTVGRWGSRHYGCRGRYPQGARRQWIGRDVSLDKVGGAMQCDLRIGSNVEFP